MLKIVEYLENHPLVRTVLAIGAILTALALLMSWANDVYSFFNPPPIRAAITDFRVEGGMVNVALTVEQEALLGTYAWVCFPGGAHNVAVLPIARSTSLRFQIGEGVPSTYVYLQRTGKMLVEFPVDLYSGTAGDGREILPENQKCG